VLAAVAGRCADQGDWPGAVRAAEKALAFASASGDPALAEAVRRRVERYRARAAGQP
jgi:hypothetical protein